MGEIRCRISVAISQINRTVITEHTDRIRYLYFAAISFICVPSLSLIYPFDKLRIDVAVKLVHQLRFQLS